MLLGARYNQASFQDWKEKDPKLYFGSYIYFEFEGSNIKKKVVVTLRVENQKIIIDQTSNDKELISGECSVQGNTFYLEGNTKLQGKFVLKYPPENAKAAVKKGILLENKFYIKTE